MHASSAQAAAPRREPSPVSDAPREASPVSDAPREASPVFDADAGCNASPVFDADAACKASPVFDADALAELLAWRRDVRGFDPRPLEPGLLERLLAATDLAPSVGLSQPWRWMRVDSPSARARVRANFARANAAALAGYAGDRAALYAALKLQGLDAAPVQLAVFVEPDPAQGAGLGRLTMPETVAYSAAIAIHTLWLAARARGVGLGWVSILEPEALCAELEAPAGWRFVALLCLGRPTQEARTPELERCGWERRATPSRDVLLR